MVWPRLPTTTFYRLRSIWGRDLTAKWYSQNETRAQGSRFLGPSVFLGAICPISLLLTLLRLQPEQWFSFNCYSLYCCFPPLMTKNNIYLSLKENKMKVKIPSPGNSHLCSLCCTFLSFFFLTRNTEGHKRQSTKKTAILSLCATDNRIAKYVNENLIELKGEIGGPTIV